MLLSCNSLTICPAIIVFTKHIESWRDCLIITLACAMHYGSCGHWLGKSIYLAVSLIVPPGGRKAGSELMAVAAAMPAAAVIDFVVGIELAGSHDENFLYHKRRVRRLPAHCLPKHKFFWLPACHDTVFLMAHRTCPGNPGSAPSPAAWPRMSICTSFAIAAEAICKGVRQTHDKCQHEKD